MGCDIHIVLERRRKGLSKWIGEFCSDNYNIVGKSMLARQRDYGFFGRLAHVRGSPKDGPSHYPKELPYDVSELAWDSYMSAATDHHSVSHLSVDDFCDAWLAEHPDHPTVRRDYAAYDLLGIDEDDTLEYRVVFWFDN